MTILYNLSIIQQRIFSKEECEEILNLDSRLITEDSEEANEYGNYPVRFLTDDTWVRNIEVSGGSKTITGTVAKTYVEKKQVSSNPDTHIRSRNVAFSADGLRPVTRFYPFFDRTSGINLIPNIWAALKFVVCVVFVVLEFL